MSHDWRHTLVAAIVLGLVCAYVVWALERFNRDKLVAQFAEQLEKLPTFVKPEGTA